MSRAGVAPAWWREACAEHGRRSLRVEASPNGAEAVREPGDVARRDFIRGEVATSADERVLHARAVLARLASTRGAFRVEIPDGRRGVVLEVLIAKRDSAEGRPWRSVLHFSHELAGVSDADALASVVAVEVERVPGAVDSAPRIVLVEVERVTIPAPARGGHDGSLERFLASKRGGHEPVDPYKRGRWDKPHLPTLPAPRVTMARPGKLGPGARVQAVEIRPDAQAAHDVVRYVGLVLDRMTSGDYAVQRLEESEAGPYGSVTTLHGSRLEPIEGERGQYA